MARVAASSEGESRLRILRVVRRGDRHDPRDLTLSVRVESSRDPAPAERSVDRVIPGEALKALVHRVARDSARGEIEDFGLALCQRVLHASEQIGRVRVELAEQPWQRIDVGGKAHAQMFVAGGPERRTAAVTSNGVQTAVVSGIDRLLLMRTSGFLPRGGPRADDGTEDDLQSLVVGSLSARWTYSSADVTFGPYRQGVRAAITETFAIHAARSVRSLLYGIADVVLATHPEILDVTLSLHERPYRPADWVPAQVESGEDLFIAVDEPVGIVELTVERDGGCRREATRAGP